MKIGEAAEALDTSIQTLRLYESNGLIKSRRTQQGTRYYTEEEMRRLRSIRSLNELGISYTEIKYIADTRLNSQTGHQASDSLRAQLSDMRHEFYEMQKKVQQNLDEIDKSLALLEQCAGCKKSPRRKICERCDVTQGLSDADLLELIWDQYDGL